MAEAGTAMPTPVVRAGVYCRISRDWEGEGNGVARQLTDCLEIAARRGWTVADRYIDNDIGASKRSKRTRRKEYDRLLADIQAGRIDAVVIWMEDRLQRQVIELAEFLKVCDAAGVTRVASAGGEFDLSAPTNAPCSTSKRPWPKPKLRGSELVGCAKSWKMPNMGSGIQVVNGPLAKPGMASKRYPKPKLLPSES
jgi:Resolvase, N terminal domain